MRNRCEKIVSLMIAITMIISTLTPTNVNADETYSYVNWEYIVKDGNITIAKYTGSETDVTVPDKIDGKKVTEIGDEAFSSNEIVESVILPEGIITIGEDAFRYCTKLISIEIPNSVKTIKSSAFEYCYALIEINLPSGLTVLEDNVFLACKSLKNLAIPESVTTIKGNAFDSCPKLTSITVPKNVAQIEYDFEFCDSLSNINVASDNKVFSSKDGVLYNKNQTSLLVYPPAKESENFIVPNSVKTIRNSAFLRSKGLKGVTIPKNVTYIGEFAFEKCVNLINVTLPDAITTIEKGTFWGCTSLIDITIPESVNKIGILAFSGCESLNSVTIPQNVKTIDNAAFIRCVNLKKVNLSKNLSAIGDKSFWGCTKLESIVIPSTVTSIGFAAFATCENLKTVKFMGKKPADIDETAFNYCNPNLTILYPQKYKSSWEDYTDHPKMSHNDVETPVSKISLNKKKIIISKGKTYRLKRKIKPIDADIKAVKWKSSNKKIATVSKKGLVKAKKVGSCTITVISKDGNKKARCKVRVVLPVEKVKLSAKQISIKKGSKYTLKATVKPKKATIKKVVWSSSNKKIAKVSKGVVTGVKRGTCYITVKSKQGNKKTRCKVVVK